VTAGDTAGNAPPPVTREELESIAARAGEIALQHFRRVAPERKSDRSLVTSADREVEAFITTALGEAWPGVGIVGEEGTARAGVGDGRFVIDPIDGTSGFVAGLPTWCVCIGLIHDGQPRAGVVHFPCTGERYSAVGGDAWWNGTLLAPLDDAAPAGDPFIVAHSWAHRRHHLDRIGKLRSLGSAAYHTVLVARGAARAALLGRVRVWDLAGAGAVLSAVHGRLELLDGRALAIADLLDGQRAADDVVAGSPAALAELRAALAG
jgi:myo-inositol-1(or 4)-monophosphatase